MKKISIQKLKQFCTEALIKEGMTPQDAQITAEVLAETDAFGTHSHGTKNLHDYIKKIRAGGIFIDRSASITAEGDAFAIIDAQDTIGMVPAYKAMELAVVKAKKSGIALVTVKNATHFGAAGFYANMAAKEGLLGICMSNVDPNMTVPGARSKAIGNNPFAYAVPAGHLPSVFLDIALSSVASLKVIQAKRDGKTIPDTWIVDSNGLPTTDPGSYPDGCAMQPMAAHKGYGLAVMVEMLTGVLSGGGTSITGDIDSWLFNMEKPNNVCHTMIAVDADRFVGRSSYLQKVDEIIDTLHELPRAEGAERIFVPGEIEWNRHVVAEKEGLVLPDDVAASLQRLSEDQQIGIDWME